MTYTLGIDLGGTSIKMIGLGEDELLLKKKLPFQDNQFASTAKTAADEFTKRHGKAACQIGVCAPGLAAKESRSIAYMPGRLDGLENLDWGELLGRPGSVPVINDAHAALIGEIEHGAARGLSDVILLTLGTGVGGAIVSGGQLLRGHIGRAGHLGHTTTDFRAPGDICRTPGSLEDAIGYCSLERRSGGKFSSTPDLVSAAEAGDSTAVEIWETSVRALAASIVSLTNAVDPEAVIIGGGIANAGAPLFDRIDRFLEEFEWRPNGHRVRVIPAELGEWAGAYGAAHLAQNPNAY